MSQKLPSKEDAKDFLLLTMAETLYQLLKSLHCHDRVPSLEKQLEDQMEEFERILMRDE